MKLEEISNVLIETGLKVTPQRIAILNAAIKLGNHPNADQILEYIRRKNPNISLATVYKVLDTLVENNLVKMVKTEKDIKRYDACLEKHHHLYYSDSEKIEDYFDTELNDLLERYFERKPLAGFKIEDLKLQIIGKSVNAKNKTR
jgi:Fur family transcriptional regulator, peroxide stress response regulator